MKNWSKAIEWSPGRLVYPESKKDIQALVIRSAEEGRKIRMIGTGHSFNPLWVTEDTLISLDQFQGLVSVDKANLKATVRGGTKLDKLGELLYEQGLAMENLGDIDAQSIAGTISTGTHGTGIGFGTISTQVIGIEFINGMGELIFCSNSDNTDLFKAAQVSLGLLGVITEITLQCVPAYKLELQNKKEDLGLVLEELDSRIAKNRNFEFFCFPHSESVWTKTSNIADGMPDKVGLFYHLTEYVVENYAFKVLCELARAFPSMNKTVSKLSAGSIPNVRKLLHSHRVYATKRLVRFNEMEYNIPIEAHKEVLKEIMAMINKRNFNIHFPIENRVVRGDDIYLSPAYQRDSAYIACHVYNKKDYKPYFQALEEIFKAHDGRPHWGKRHFWSKEDVIQNYPKYEAFSKHSKEQDPKELFVNNYLKDLLV